MLFVRAGNLKTLQLYLLQLMFPSFLGPYAPAILRFHIIFPSPYPNSPPLLTFTSDIFHPLVSASTTYTHAIGSLTSGFSVKDGESLPPGGFSLRHGFPAWFEEEVEEGIGLETSKDVKISTTVETEGRVAPTKHEQSGLPSVKMVEESGTVGSVSAGKEAENEAREPRPRTIFKILQYMKRAFEDEALLDELPLDAAANPGAWKAWRAHRDNTAPTLNRNKTNVPPNTPQRTLGEGNKTKSSNDWSWSGIWEQRVDEGIESSISDPVLYGNTDNDDLVCLCLVYDYGSSNHIIRLLSWILTTR